MKKIIAMMLALLLVASLCACGKGDEGNSGDQNAKENNSGNNPADTSNVSDTPMGHAMEVNGVTFGVGMDAEQVVAKLGTCEPVITESCGDMGGNDYEYAYDDFIIYANDGGGAVRIYCVEIISDLATTAEGLTIGDTAKDVKSTCGDPTSETETGLIYEEDGMQMIFILDNGEVTSVQYLEK